MPFLHKKNIQTDDNYFVYFIQQKGKGNQPVKIGYSKDPRERLKTLQTGNPRELLLRVNIPCETEALAIHLERCLHRIAGSKHRALQGEWFMIYGGWAPLIESAYKASEILDSPDRVSDIMVTPKNKNDKLEVDSDILDENKRLSKKVKFLERIVQRYEF